MILLKKHIATFMVILISAMLLSSQPIAQEQDSFVETRFIAETSDLSTDRPTWLAFVINLSREASFIDLTQSIFELTLPEGLSLNTIVITLPKKLQSDEVSAIDGALFEIASTKKATLGAFLPISLNASITLCQKNSPQQCQILEIEKTLTITKGRGLINPVVEGTFQQLRDNTPILLPWISNAIFKKEQEHVLVSIYMEESRLKSLQNAKLYPQSDNAVIDGIINIDQQKIDFQVPRNGAMGESLEAILDLDGAYYQLATPVRPERAAGYSEPTTGLTATPSKSSMTLWFALVSAFIGGVILNLMPCVFPILAIKAFSLVKAGSQSRSAMIEDGVSYSLGVMSTFLVVAAVLISFQSMGQQIGWGFQLQNPYFILALIAIMLAVAFNLLGLFEVHIPNFLSNLINKNNNNTANSAFGTGILATVMATPCTAPFMGSALGFALGQPPIYALGIFMALGVGMAFPYLALSSMPSLARKIPKPGPWMVTFKKALSAPVFLTATWLIWVFYLQTGGAGLGLLVLLTLVAAFLGFSIKLAQNKGRLIKAVLFALAFGGVHLAFEASDINLEARKTTILEPLAEGIETTSFSTENIAYYRRQGRPVFINFTASWCITCKVTERLLFSTENFQQVMRDNNIVYMVADWTNPDPEIDAYLKSKGRQGIPFYLYHPNDGVKNDIILPDVLTLQSFKDAVE